MSNINIIVDFDNTIVNSTKAIWYVYRDITHDFSTKLEDLRSWYLTDICPLWSAEEVNNTFSDSRFYQVLEPIQGMIQLLEKLHNQGHRIIICTCHDAEGIPLKDKYIQEHLSFVDEVIYIRYKGKIGKSNILGDIIIDDSLDALNSSSVRYKICLVIMLTTKIGTV